MAASFAERLAIGTAFEQQVARLLLDREWDVDPWGQGMLSDPVRQALQRTDSAFRWEPDLVAARGRRLVLIDCKARMTSTVSERHIIDRRAFEAQRLLAAARSMLMVYVFDTLTVLTADDVAALAMSSSNTGKAKIFIGTGMARPFDEVFGAPPATQLRFRY